MERSDLELIQEIKDGSKDALDPLVRRWYPRVYAYVFKMTANEQDSYDITQDVFIAVMQNIPRFHPWNRLESWLFTIAHNKCMDYFRMRRRLVPTELPELDRQDPAPLLEESVPVSVTVEQALDRLSGVQREAVILHYFHQFSAIEISRMTQTPLPTVKSRLASARRLLKTILQEDFP